MEIIFKDKDLEELIAAGKNKHYKKIVKDNVLMNGLIRAYTTLLFAKDIMEVQNISFLHYERLKHDYTGISSIRIVQNRVERLLFTENENKIEITLSKLDTTHYGNKK